jgi:hypothetical protein
MTVISWIGGPLIQANQWTGKIDTMGMEENSGRRRGKYAFFASTNHRLQFYFWTNNPFASRTQSNENDSLFASSLT